MPAAATAEALPSGPIARKQAHEPHFAVWELLEAVTDPEIPVVSLREMGILRSVQLQGAALEVVITPTYSGCPAMAQMEDDIVQALARAGWSARVRTQLAPAWSTDWMTPQARDKLRAYGIAPPQPCGVSTPGQVLHFLARKAPAVVACPQCGSDNTTEPSYFGSTACKALYRCLNCLEPFDYFKPY
ncbi:MAG: 1,2-phenylacetyl-CoA epoxidase subunit PaaD [Rhodoferax sp.]